MRSVEVIRFRRSSRAGPELVDRIDVAVRIGEEQQWIPGYLFAAMLWDGCIKARGAPSTGWDDVVLHSSRAGLSLFLTGAQMSVGALIVEGGDDLDLEPLDAPTAAPRFTSTTHNGSHQHGES